MEITTTWKRLVGGAAALISGLALGHQAAADVVNVPAGYLTGEVSWKSTNTYILQGFVYVVDGATLRIEPGTVVKGVAGTSSANFGNLFICQGGKLFAEGTAQKPIIFTAENDDVNDPTDLGPTDQQLWGGIILFGKARVNNAVNATGDAATPKYDIYEGLPDVQGPNNQYLHRFGGSDDNDSSGVMRYVSLRHGGKVLESNKEVNGLSICGVGRGTTLEFIEVFANSDDGFEFFGGCVNTRYLVSAFNGDEQFDADEGYNGKNQFWFGIHLPDSVEKGMEINGEPQDRITGKGVPASTWEIYNATTIGAGARAGAGTANNGFTFRAYTQVGVYNGIFTDFNGLPVTGKAFTTGATPTVQNNIWWNFTLPTFEPTGLFDSSTGNRSNVDPLLGGISRLADGKLNPLPQPGSPALTGAKTPPNDGFYTPTSYVGAFDSSNNWMRGWTFLDKGGFLTPQSNVVNVPAGYITGDVTWKSTNTYILQGFVYVVDGATLRIEPGTVVKGVAGTSSANFGNLFICRGGKIFAEGTPDRPIIFTAESDDVDDPTDLGPTDQQLWGGIILFGKARINNAVNATGDAATPKYDIYEGLPDAQGPNGQYLHRFGGSDDDDSSGIMRYVSLRHGGKVLESNKEVNGLSICGVGRGTTLEFIEVFANSDDGFEFFGGCVNTRYLVSAFNGDEQFDADEGYNGKNQFWFGIHLPDSVEKGMEINGEPQDRITGKGVPASTWEIYNATTIGAGARAGAGTANNGFTFRAYTQVGVYNGIFTDFNGLPVTGKAFTTGATPTVQNNIWWNFTLPTFEPAGLFAAGTGNRSNVDPMLGGISRVADGKLNPLLQPGSPALTGAKTPPNDGFYTPTSYVGAFDTQNDWLRRWTFLDKGGFLTPRTNIVNVPAGYISGDVTWKNTNIYVLQGFVYVLEGATLRIEPGTVVKGVAGTSSANFGNLFICQGGKIFAEGTPQNPIIFTAEDDDLNDPTDLGPTDQQLWGGIILFGKARINNAVNAGGDAATPKYDIYEGLPDTKGPNGQYLHRFGGSDDEDSSGVLRYVSLRHGGKVLESNKEVNGLSICGVGRGTKLEFIEVFANSDDGFEFFGGSVNTRYLVSAFNGDEEFDADEGYNGKNQFWFGIQLSDSVEKGMEINGEPQDRITGKGVPVSNWEIYNATTVGAGARVGAGTANNGFTFRAYTQVGVYNGIFTDFNGLPVTGKAFTTGATPTVKDNIWWKFTLPTFEPASLFAEGMGNLTSVDPQIRGISRTADLGLDPRPQTGSPATLSPRVAPANGFYSDARYYGAFTSGGNWAVDWTFLGNSGIMNPQGAYNPVPKPMDPVGPKTLTVTTTSDVPVAGQTTLSEALALAGNGDTIQFNIPGAGPHYIKTPAGGYPLIKVSNLTIDGYSQPGSSPNTNPILAANNAKIQIVLDSRNGNSTLLDFAGDTANDSTGYGDTESAILGFYQGTNNVVRGLCLLAVPLTGANQDVSLYGVSFAKGANGHISGCWIGVDLDGKTKPFIAPADGVTGFRYRGKNDQNQVTNTILISGVTVGVAKGSKNPRSEFNVIAGVPGIPAILEGENHRISGNFLGVLPDGNTDYNVALVEELKGNFEGYIEIGRAGNNTVIGVDGDGANDADERNVFGGMLPESLGGYNHTIEFYGQTPGTNIVVAGNYFGMGVDGKTRFVNAVSPLNAPGGSAVYQFGSDLDGVSDSLEGNVVYNNWPQATLTEVVAAGALQPFFSELNQTAIVSLRGNTLVNNYTPPVDPLKSDGAFLTNYYSRVVANVDAGLVPTLDPSSTVRRIVGTLPKPNASYPVATIDLYVADAEGIATGKAVDAALYPNGWVQGAKYLMSFVDNGIGDKDPAVGAFEFVLPSDVAPVGTLLTVTANYSAVPAGTHDAVVVTTLFSAPVAVQAVGPLATAHIKPAAALPVEMPRGSVAFGAPGAMTIAGPGLVAWPAASNADQPGDVQEFAYEEISGDFDISTKVTSVTSGPVTDPVDAWASGGLQARADLGALSPSFLVNVGNPKGVNEVRAIGRAIAAQNYTTFGRTYPGVDKTLPSQWIRLRRVGNWFAAYVGTDGSSWALVGQRWQEWPDKLLVGAYAFSASYNSADQTGGKNLSTVAFSNYGKTVQNDNVAPALVSAATMGKKVVGVKFSEPVASSGALVAANYTLSQGTVTAVQGGIGGDSVYLTVSGLTADTFDVTVNNVTDTAGNALPAGSKVTGRSSAWKSTDIGLIQSGNPEVRTAGDDPYRIGQAVAVASGSTETEIEIIGGGSNAWNPGDYIHYVSGIPLVGDFEVTVEVSRNDRPANTAAWANSGLMLRESEYVPGQQYTQDGTKVAMVANTTYIEGSAPNRAGIPLWREEPGAGYGNGNPGFAWTTPIGGIKGYYLDQRAIDAAGTPDPESSPLSSRWLRIKRAGNDFSFFVSYDGWEWALLDGPKTLPLSSQLLFGFSTMSDTGSGAPPNNAYGGNGFLGTDLEGQQNPSNYSVQRIRIGTNVTPRGPGPVTPTVNIQGSTVTFTGKLQEASSLNGPFTEVQGAKSPYTIPVGSEIRFYRASN